MVDMNSPLELPTCYAVGSLRSSSVLWTLCLSDNLCLTRVGAKRTLIVGSFLQSDSSLSLHSTLLLARVV